jgi:quercetin dioxygenase-like cupin family protein
MGGGLAQRTKRGKRRQKTLLRADWSDCVLADRHLGSSGPITRRPAGSLSMQQQLTAGVTQAGTGLDGIAWNILGQTYVPKSVSESSFGWHATFPPGTFVPPHIHPTQDEFIYMLEGRFDLMLDGKDAVAQPGDLIRLPMQVPHGIFNKTDQTVKCFFWVSPTRKLYDLFWAIHNMKEQTPPEVVTLSAKYEVNFLPPPP